MKERREEGREERGGEREERGGREGISIKLVDRITRLHKTKHMYT